MATAIRATNSNNIRVSNVTVIGMDAGFDFSGSTGIEMENVNCQDTRVAVYGENVRDLRATNVNHSEADNVPQPTALAVAIWRIVHGYV